MLVDQAAAHQPLRPGRPGLKALSRDTCLTMVLLAGLLAAWGQEQAADLRLFGPAYTPDSASYVECARSLLTGEGCQMRYYTSLKPRFWREMTIWPPGFSLLIAGVSSIGAIPAPQAGLWIALASTAAALVAVFLIARRFLPPFMAFAVSLGAGLMPALLEAGKTCLSDTLYLALAAWAMLCLLKGAQPVKGLASARGWLALAGGLSGWAWSVRYVGIALIAAMACFLLAQWLWAPRRDALLRFSAWFTGLVAGAGPLALHNLVKYSRPAPYGLLPSTVPLQENLRTAMAVILGDLTTWTTGANSLAAFLVYPLALIVLLGLGLFLLARHREVLRRPGFFLALFFGLNAAVVVLARSTYQWGELINSRHFLPAYWILWLGLGTLGVALGGRIGLASRSRISMAAAGLLLLAGLQWQSHRAAMQEFRLTPRTVQADPALYDFIHRAVKPQQLVYATNAYLLRLFADVNARMLYRSDVPDATPLEDEATLRAAAESGLLWGFVIHDVPGAREGRYGPWLQRLMQEPQTVTWLEPVAFNSPILLLRAK